MQSPKDYLPKIVEMALRWRTVIVAPYYRRAPEVKQPRGFEDVRAAFKYFYANAEKYHFDRKKMALGGMSGGAFEALGAAKIMAKQGEVSMIQLLVLE